MRKVTAGLFAAIDGVAEAPDVWQFDRFDDELGALMGGMLAQTDTVLLGRLGYEEWSQYWPTAPTDDPFGSFINPVEKFVASTTLRGDLDWNATLIEGDLLDFVRELKQGEGGDIAVNAGLSLTRQLFLGGLLDELTLVIHPVIAGSGRRLFESTDAPVRLELVRSSTTSKGNIVVTYALRD